MFERLGRFAARYRVPIIVGWVVLAVALMLTAPNLEDVSSTNQEDFLLSSAESVHAQEVYERVFPQEFTPSSTIVLIDAGSGGNVREPEIWNFIIALEAWLASAEAPENIETVFAPTTDPAFADMLISPDGRIALVSAGISTPTDAVQTTQAVEAIDAWLEEHTPTTIEAYQTGEAALNAQAERAMFATMDRTIVITLALVIIALLAIYRSPVSPLIPLFAVTMAFLVTMGLVALLAQWNVITVIAQLNAMLVVIIYGAGTDYCLFLISRFREEMAEDHAVIESTRRTVRLVGETITSSAGTIFVGFMSLTFAEIGAFRSAGPVLAIGILISLLAGLTLVPALLATLGDRAFWPGKARHRSAGRFYEMTSKQVSTHPLITILVIVVIMAPFSVVGLNSRVNYDMISEMPDSAPAVRGYTLMQAHMGGGNLFPLTVVVTDRNPATIAAEIARLEGELAALDGVTDVRSLNRPLGSRDERFTNLLRVDGQLDLLVSLAQGESDTQDFNPQQLLNSVGAMQRYVDLIAERFPAVADDANLATLRDILSGGLLGVALRQNDLFDAARGLADRFRTIEDAYLIPPTGEGDLFADMRPLVESYLAADGVSYRIDVVLAEVLSEEGMDSVLAIRNLLRGYAGDGDAVVSGFTATMTDLRDTMERDEMRTFGFVLAGIFVVLLVMLRSVIAPLYLIGTVVLSFTCTLGITSLFFRIFLGIGELSWMLKLFMFVMLVALGIDYSIFLFGRVKEEVGHHGIREGVHVAVAATGAIITSAGIILAGTFAGMMAGEFRLLMQLGFAVCVGVLIDTFVVRTMLDPALATLFGRWTWWPGGVPKARNTRSSAAMTPAQGTDR